MEPGGESFPLFVDQSVGTDNQFAIYNHLGQWLAFSGDYRWTNDEADRIILQRSTKLASHEGEVGQLAEGEVALYEHVAHHGRTWILSGATQNGNFPGLDNFSGLQDITSSIRLGPNTGATLFRHNNFRVTDESKREEESEDIIEDVPSLFESQIGNDALSSVKIFKSVSPDEIFTSISSKLSQDYRMVDGKLEEFSAYRTILRFEPGAGEVEVSATDLTQIEVDGTIHTIDEVRSVTLRPNEINRLMITSEADGLDTPGLKIRTSDMPPNEQVVIFPNKEMQKQIAEMDDDALWNATDAQGNLIVDQNAHSQEEVAAVQKTIKRTMAAVVHAETSTSTKSNTPSRIQSTEPIVAAANVGNAWELQLKPDGANGGTSSGQTASLGSGNLISAVGAGGSSSNGQIVEKEIGNDAFAALLSQATDADSGQSSPPIIIGGRPVGNLKIIRRVGNFVKKATKVVVGAVKDVLNVIVETAEGVFKFVIDTAKKVAEFVEAVVEKVVKGIKEFIEFLQFLFGWGDILATQRYLVGTVNGALDFATQLADDAKPHVTSFFNNLQDSVEDGMNSLIRTLGGDPSEAPDSDDELPEALEWFLSKLFGKSQQSGTKTGSDGGTTPAGNTPLESFMRHLLEAVADVVGAGGSILEGLGDTVEALLQNPKKPQLALAEIIEALRDVIIQLLDAGENITLALLDVVEFVTDLFKKLLNTEIRIPFISDLFELIGGGKLTILNLSMLLLAIPVTVVHKIAFNKRPFKSAPPLNFSLQSKAQPAALALTGPANQVQPANAEAASSPESLPTEGMVLGFGITALVANALNGIILKPLLNLTPEFADDANEKNLFLGVLEAITWVLDVFIWIPTIPGLLKEGKFGDADPEEITLWVYRTFVLGLDLGFTIFGWTRDPKNTQRMERATETTIVLSTMLGMLDMLFASLKVSTIFEDTNLDGESAIPVLHELLFGAPRAFAFLRFGAEGAIALALLNIIVASATSVTGGVLLANDFRALKAAT